MTSRRQLGTSVPQTRATFALANPPRSIQGDIQRSISGGR